MITLCFCVCSLSFTVYRLIGPTPKQSAKKKKNSLKRYHLSINLQASERNGYSEMAENRCQLPLDLNALSNIRDLLTPSEKKI